MRNPVQGAGQGTAHSGKWMFASSLSLCAWASAVVWSQGLAPGLCPPSPSENVGHRETQGMLAFTGGWKDPS